MIAIYATRVWANGGARNSVRMIHRAECYAFILSKYTGISKKLTVSGAERLFQLAFKAGASGNP